MSKEHDVNNFDSLSERLNFLIETAGVKKNHLASKIGITPQALNHLCKRGASRSRHTEEIARALNANPEWLASGMGEPFKTIQEEDHQLDYQVGIYDLKKLRAIYGVENILKFPPEKKLLINIESNHKLMGFFIENNDLSPRIVKNDIVIIECKNDYMQGDLALIYSNTFKRYLFCYLHEDSVNNLLFGFVPSPEIGLFQLQKEDLVYGSYKLSIRTV